MGLVRYRAQDDQEADAERAPELLCRFRKQPEPVVVLQRGAMALAQVAQTTQPACIHELGEVHQRHRPLLPVDQDTASMAMSPFRRQNPREEPGALAAHAGICAGGGQQRPSLPRPSHDAHLSRFVPGGAYQSTTYALYPFVPSGPDFAASLAFFQE